MKHFALNKFFLNFISDTSDQYDWGWIWFWWCISRETKLAGIFQTYAWTRLGIKHFNITLLAVSHIYQTLKNHTYDKIGNECLQEEVEHLGKFLVNEVSFMSNRELEGSHLPPLGSRVRRGPDWKYNNQDQGGPGTVVGHDGGTVSEAQFKVNLWRNFSLHTVSLVFNKDKETVIETGFVKDM